MEDKKKICDLLCAALKATRGGADLIELDYSTDGGEETVTVVFLGSRKTANVTMDSGVAMIRDIMHQIF